MAPVIGPPTTASGSAASTTIARPTRSGGSVYQPGDVMILAVTGGTPNTPSGFARVGGSATGTGAIFYQTMGFGEPANYNISFGANTTYLAAAVLVNDVGRFETVDVVLAQTTDRLTMNQIPIFDDGLIVLVGLLAAFPAGIRLNTPNSMALHAGAVYETNTPNRHIRFFDQLTLSNGTITNRSLVATGDVSNIIGGAISFRQAPRPVTPAFYNVAPTVYAPAAIGRGSRNVGSVARFDNTRGIFDPNVNKRPVTLRPQFLSRTPEVYAPTLRTTGIPFLDRVYEYYPLALRVNKVTTRPQFLDRGGATYEPSVKVGPKTIFPGRLDFGRTVHDPALRAGSRTIGTVVRFDGSRAVYAPQTVRRGAVKITPGFLPSNFVDYGVSINPNLTPTAQEMRKARITANMLSGKYGTLHYTPRLFLSNIYGDELAPLPGVEEASVNLSNYRDNTWELALDVGVTDAFDPVRDYVMCALDVRSGSLPTERFPLGLYRFEFPSGEDEPTGSSWSLTGESLECLLMRAMATGGYRVAPGAKVLESVRNLLTSRGIPASRITFPRPAEDKTLPNGLYFDPVTDEEGSYFIRIANSLLGAGGFGTLQTNESGQFTTSKTVSIGEKNPSVLYGPPELRSHLSSDDMLLAGPIPRQPSYDRFANEVFVSSQDVNQEPAIRSVARNENPNSPVSIPNLGYTVTKTVQMETIPDQETADTMARAELARATAFHMVRDILTMPDPRRGPDEVYRIVAVNDSGERVMRGKWLVNNWELDLSREPGEMRHQVSRGEEFDEE